MTDELFTSVELFIVADAAVEHIRRMAGRCPRLVADSAIGWVTAEAQFDGEWGPLDQTRASFILLKHGPIMVGLQAVRLVDRQGVRGPTCRSAKEVRAERDRWIGRLGAAIVDGLLARPEPPRIHDFAVARPRVVCEADFIVARARS